MRDWAENQVTLALIRHGETRANRERRYLGKTDDPLSGQGIQALLSYQAQGHYPEVGYLFSSPMARCMETAKLLYPKLAPTVIPEWEEMDFGQFEYKNFRELEGDAQYQAWLQSGGTLGFPGGESRESFIKRCEKGFFHMCRKLQEMAAQEDAGTPIRVGLIVHGGTVMALLSSFGGKEYFSCQAPNGRGYLCRMGRQHLHPAGSGLQARAEIQIEVVEEI